MSPDHRRVLPVANLADGFVLVLVLALALADLAARTADAPNELPLGIFTAVRGAPFFLWRLRRGTSNRVGGPA